MLFLTHLGVHRYILSAQPFLCGIWTPRHQKYKTIHFWLTCHKEQAQGQDQGGGGDAGPCYDQKGLYYVRVWWRNLISSEGDHID